MNTTLDNSTLFIGTPNRAQTSKRKRWTGRILTGLPALWLAFGGVLNQLDIPQIVEDAQKMGYSLRAWHVLGYVLIAVGVLLCFRRTQVLGAVIATGYLGGAVATHVSHGDPARVFAMPILLAVAIWGGLALQNDRVRALSPFAR
jgi:hypothetical protein